MRKCITALLCVLALAAAGLAQQNPPAAPQQQTSRLGFPVFGLNAVPLQGATIQIVGQPGQATWYLWAAVNYTEGQVVSSIGTVTNAPNTLSGSNYIGIYPIYPPSTAGATVDILATTTPLQPVGSCGCAVSTGNTSGPILFQSNTTGAYTVTPLNPTSLRLWVTNEIVSAGTAHLLLRNEAGTLVCDLSVGCGSGGISGSGTAGLMPVFTGATAVGNSPIAASSALLVFGSPASLTGGTGVTENNQFNGLGSACSDSVSIPIGTSLCSGFKLLDQAAPTTNLGYMAGLSVIAENTAHNTSKLIGLYVNAESGTSGVTTDEYGGYVFAEESIVTTVTNRHGFYVLAYNDTPNISALNEGLVAQTGGNGGTTNTLDYSIHVLAPANGDTLTTHAGIEIDAQGTGVPLQAKPQAFGLLPTCNSTYEGSHAAISDSTTATWGATIAGSGANHVWGYCDGTHWTVEAI